MEVQKATKKQKEECKSTIGKLRERVTRLEHEDDDLEQDGRHLCVRVKDIPAANDKTADKVLEKVKNILKVA